MVRSRVFLIGAAVACAAAASVLTAQTAAPAVPAPIRNIFESRCAGCHSGASPAAGMNLDADHLAASILDKPSSEKPDLKIADTAAPDRSYILLKLQGAAGISGSRMPRRASKLSDADIRALADWIAGLKRRVASPAETKHDLKLRPSGA